MSYAMVIDQAGITLETYRKIQAELGNVKPEGQLVHSVGTSETGLRFIDIWESKAHADRFAAEILMPAFVAVLGAAPADTVFSAVELDELAIGASS